jgi:hypothetical protein
VLEGLCIDATAPLCLGSVHPSLIKPSAGEEPRG